MFPQVILENFDSFRTRIYFLFAHGLYFYQSSYVQQVMLVEEAAVEVQLLVFTRLLEFVKKESNAQNLSNVSIVGKVC